MRPPALHLSTPAPPTSPLPAPPKPNRQHSRPLTRPRTRKLKCPICSTSIPLPPPPLAINSPTAPVRLTDIGSTDSSALLPPLIFPGATDSPTSPSICHSCLARFRSPNAESVNRREDTLTSFPGLFEERGSSTSGSSGSHNEEACDDRIGDQQEDTGVTRSWLGSRTQGTYGSVIRRMFSFGFGFGLGEGKGKATDGEGLVEREEVRRIEVVRERRLTAGSVGTTSTRDGGSVVHEEEVGA